MEKIFAKKIEKKEDFIRSVAKHMELTPRINSVIDIRYDEIKNYAQILNEEAKFYFITGFSGIGKSEILKLTPALLDNSLFFCFDCFKTACMDDVIFSLYRYFLTIKSAKIQHLIKRTFSQTRSIDERILELLKDFPVKFVIAFDSFDNLINKNTDRLPHEIAKFLDFLAQQENIKIITASNVAPFEIIKKHPDSHTLHLEPLAFNHFMDIKNSLNVPEGDLTLEAVCEETFGIPRNIRIFFKAIKDESKPSDFFKEASSQKIEFNEYVAKHLVNGLNTEDLNTLYYLSAMRHPVTIDTIYSILPNEFKKNFDRLAKTAFVYLFEGHYFVKEIFSKHISLKIGKAQREKVHTALCALYEAEIPLKHYERNIKLSRTTLRNEFAYHLKLSEKKKSNQITLMASTMNSDVIMFQETKVLPPREDNIEIHHDPKNKPEPSKILKQTEDMAIQNMNTHHLSYDVPVGMEFSEEERKLLYEEAKELQIQDEKKKPKEKEKKKLIIDEVPIDTDFKKSKIIDNTDYYKMLEAAIDFESQRDYQNALPLYIGAQKACHVKEKEFYIHTKIANCYTKLKNKNEAVMALKGAYTIAHDLDDNSKIAFVLLSIAQTLKAFGEYKLAEKHYNDFLDMQVLKSLPLAQVMIALLGLGDLYIDMNQESNALTVYQAALKQAGFNNPVLNEIYFKIALTFDNMGDIKNAKEFYERGAQRIFFKQSYDKYYSESCASLGGIFAEEGDYTKALALLEKSYEMDKKYDRYEAIVQSTSRIADTYFDLKDYKQALKFYYEKLKAAKNLGTPYVMASSYLDVGDVYIRMNNLPKALRAFVLSKKSIGDEISTDSKVKIDRRIEFIKNKMDKKEFESIVRQSK
ncbi:MAG: tetratricopeptide repeat protein [Candidatus Gastranaerophilales bacterium]|nr:tetratricopeptide repeat protein [Candidatus Gastranaerophilales bacterium]